METQQLATMLLHQALAEEAEIKLLAEEMVLTDGSGVLALPLQLMEEALALAGVEAAQAEMEAAIVALPVLAAKVGSMAAEALEAKELVATAKMESLLLPIFQRFFQRHAVSGF